MIMRFFFFFTLTTRYVRTVSHIRATSVPNITVVSLDHEYRTRLTGCVPESCWRQTWYTFRIY